jgi:hypothetical protein
MNRPLVYDPNVDLSDYVPNNSFKNNEQYNNFEQYTPPQQQYTPPPQQQYMPPPQQYTPQQYTYQEDYYQQSSPRYNQYEQLYNTMKPKKSKKVAKFSNSKNNLLSSLKKIIIFTLLYVFMSHRKMTLLLCNKVPFLSVEKILYCNVFKGVLFSIIILLIVNIM